MKFKIDAAPAIEILPEALVKILALARDFPHEETGGIIVGFNEGADLRISDVSEAGPNAQRSKAYFLRDTEYCQNYLDTKFQETGADYVGEWHSHVVDLRRLSGGDLETIASLFIDPDYDFITFAIVLVVMRDQPELHVYLAERLRPKTCLPNSRERKKIAIRQLYAGPFPEVGANQEPATK